MTPRLAALLIGLYTGRGDTIIDLTSDPSIAGAAGPNDTRGRMPPCEDTVDAGLSHQELRSADRSRPAHRRPLPRPQPPTPFPAPGSSAAVLVPRAGHPAAARPPSVDHPRQPTGSGRGSPFPQRRSQEAPPPPTASLITRSCRCERSRAGRDWSAVAASDVLMLGARRSTLGGRRCPLRIAVPAAGGLDPAQVRTHSIDCPVHVLPLPWSSRLSAASRASTTRG
jgi:hypothetical protein